MAAAAQQELVPWGRLRITSKKPARENETLDLRRSVHRFGRLASKADLVVDRPYISALVRGAPSASFRWGELTTVFNAGWLTALLH